MVTLSIGLEAGYDPGWLAGLQYVRNLTYTLITLPLEDRPNIRLLPVNAETVVRISDLAKYDKVEVAANVDSRPVLLEGALKVRRFKRKALQPRLQRLLDGAFHDLDVTYPGWGTPLPGVPQMHWVPDLQHVFLPELFDQAEIEARDADLRRLASLDATLIFSSRSALADFRKFFPTSSARTRVWQFCSPITEHELDASDAATRFDLPKRFIYVANQFWAHKEHLTLFKALVILRDRGLCPPVVCTGLLADRRKPAYVEEVNRYLLDNQLEAQVRLLGVVPRPDQILVLRHSTVVVQPSKFEGWSTVVEDAKAVGRPLILSDFRVHLEQAPQHAFFQLGSAESLADAIAECWSELPSGPDEQAEEAAREWLEGRRSELAREFISISTDEISHQRARA